jgi:hypothetical protein
MEEVEERLDVAIVPRLRLSVDRVSNHSFGCVRHARGYRSGHASVFPERDRKAHGATGRERRPRTATVNGFTGVSVLLLRDGTTANPLLGPLGPGLLVTVS